MRYDSISFM